MTTSSTSDKTKTAAKATKSTKADECLVQDCVREPAHRGLCKAHWQTHRGLATPKEDSPDE